MRAAVAERRETAIGTQGDGGPARRIGHRLPASRVGEAQLLRAEVADGAERLHRRPVDRVGAPAEAAHRQAGGHVDDAEAGLQAEPVVDDVSELAGRSLYWPRGKMLGGTSSMNAQMHVRGNRADYDGWAELGNARWSYDDVLPYFRRSEHNERGPSDFRGTGGPLNIADLRDPHPATARHRLPSRKRSGRNRDRHSERRCRARP